MSISRIRTLPHPMNETSLRRSDLVEFCRIAAEMEHQKKEQDVTISKTESDIGALAASGISHEPDKSEFIEKHKFDGENTGSNEGKEDNDINTMIAETIFEKSDAKVVSA